MEARKVYRSTVTITLLSEEPFTEGCLECIWECLDSLEPISDASIAYNDKVFTNPSDELTAALLEMANDGSYFDGEADG